MPGPPDAADTIHSAHPVAPGPAQPADPLTGGPVLPEPASLPGIDPATGHATPGYHSAAADQPAHHPGTAAPLGPSGSFQQPTGGFPPGAGQPWSPPPAGAGTQWQPFPAQQPHQAQPVWHEPPKPPSTLWTWLSREGAGSRILAWAGGVVTLAGVVLLLILAIQRGYLGPLPRVLLGAGLGLTLAGIGAWLHRNPTARTGAYALAATGSAVVYLDVVAATSLYGFLTDWGGLLTGLAVTAGGIALAGVWNSQLFAVFVVVCCAASAPIITHGFDGLLLSFLLVLLLATTPVQLAKRWYGLLIAAGLPPVIVSLVNIAMERDAAATAILAGITSVVVGALTTVTAIRRPDDDFTLAMFCLAPVPGMFAAILLPRLGAAVLPAAIGALLLLVWLLGYVTSLPRTFALTAGGLASLAFLQATATAFDGDARAIAFLAEALVLTALAVRLRLKTALLPAALFAMVGLVLGLADAVRPDLLLQPRSVDIARAVTLGLTGALVAAVAITLCWAGFRLEVLPGGERAPHGWVPAGLLALYGSTATLLSVGLLISQDRDGFLLGHVFVTVSWTLAALVLLLRGIESVPLRVAGLSLVVAALTKLVLFDLSSLDGMARVMAFLVAGLVLLAAGARYAKLVATRVRS